MTATLPPLQLVTRDAPTSGLSDAAARLTDSAADFRRTFLADQQAGAALEDSAVSATIASPADAETVGRRLDWASRHDPASREYAVRSLIRHPVPIQDRLWPTGPVLDQGVDGACTGFAAAAASNVLEAIDGGSDFLDAAGARAIFDRAQQLDQVPGEDPSTGSSVLAAMLAARERIHWDGFVWSFGTRDLAQGILQVGPAVIGVPWLSGMNDVDVDGVLTVTGSMGMGHSLAVVGLVVQHAGRPGPWFKLQNSWGTSWGVDGFAYVHHKQMGRLLAGVGEAAIPVTGP